VIGLAVFFIVEAEKAVTRRLGAAKRQSAAPGGKRGVEPSSTTFDRNESGTRATQTQGLKGVMIGLNNRTRPYCWGITVFFIVLLIAWGPCSAAGTEAFAGGPVRTAAEIDYPPFSFVDEQGRVSGFSVELLRAALTAMGRDSTFRTGPWAEVRTWLEEGAIDALPLVGRTPEREQLFDFTFPYMTLHGAIVVRDETEDIHDLDDLKGRTVAVMQGDNAEEFLRREERGIQLHTTATFDQALQELAAGRHDAVVIQRLVALRLVNEGNFTNLRIINRPVEAFRQDFCFAVRAGDRTTLALLNEGLALVIADGTYRRLHAKWFAALELPTRRLVIGGDENFPPYEYLDEHGQPAGYNVDLTRAIAREVGLDIEIRLGPWAQIRENLVRGEIDAVQGMFYSPERDRSVDFTAPHTVNHIVGVVRRGEGGAPATLADMAGKRIVVQDGDIMLEFARANGLDSQLTVVSAQEDALRQLTEGQHDVALVSRLTAHYWIEKNKWHHLQVGRMAFLSPDYCFAVPLNHKALLAQLGEGLKVLEQTGEYRRIHEKWLGVYSEDPPSLRAILRYVFMVAGPLLALLTAFFSGPGLCANRWGNAPPSYARAKNNIACLPIIRLISFGPWISSFVLPMSIPRSTPSPATLKKSGQGAVWRITVTKKVSL
jgi:two-component system, cell cycle sensor histidine kinase and response regulator CckA